MRSVSVALARQEEHGVVRRMGGVAASRPGRWVTVLLMALFWTLLPAVSNAQTDEADACVRDLGTLDGATSSLSGSGIIARDAACTSPQADPNDSVSTYYARRHTFTLAVDSSVSFGRGGSYRTALLIEGASIDGSGVVLGRHSGSHLVLAAGTYTIEATTTGAGYVGDYSVWVQRYDLTPCVRDLGTLDGATSSLSGSGIIARDAACTSPQADPNDSVSTYYARRHTFTLAVDSSVSFGRGGSYRTALLIEGASIDGSGVVLGRHSGSHLVLAAGTYTIEATTTGAGYVGDYSVWVQRYDLTPCVRDLGTLDGATSSLSGSGIIARDAACTSPQADPNDSVSTYYARRHTFTLAVDSSVSFGRGGSYRTALLIEGASIDGSGVVLGRHSGSHLVLAAGTYTIEATTTGAGYVGDYSVWVQRYDLTPCVRDLGTLDGATSSLSGSGIIARDAACTSPQADPNDSVSTYYARRHTFTLAVDSSVSFGRGGSYRTALLIEGASIDGSGVVLGRGGGSHLVLDAGSYTLDAGTYTIEATTTGAGYVGDYSVWVQRYDLTPCVRDLGTLDGAASSLSGSGIIAQDASCTSSQRDPNDAVSTFYARRHTFTLDAAATVSVSLDDANSSGLYTYLLLIQGRSADGSGAVVARASHGGTSYNGPRPARLDHLLLQAGTYTIEATTSSVEATGDYTAGVRWAPADACVRDLGTLDGAASSLSGSGIIAQDASCTSSQRDPNDAVSTFYARRHTFTLDAAATVSVSLDDANSSGLYTYLLLIQGRSADGSGAVVARASHGGTSYNGPRPARLDHLLLQAGTYTIEATTSSVEATGDYTAGVRWAPADACVRDLGTLDGAASSLSGSGIIAQDASCTSSQRDPNDAVSTFYARRHTFTLDAAATVSVSLDDANSSGLYTYLLLIQGRSADGSGAVVARASHGGTSYNGPRPARLDHLLLQAGTYTIEATTSSVEATGDYTAGVRWAPADACVRDLGTLDGAASSLSGSGIIAQDASCTSSQRDPNDAVSTFYARRHTFTLDAAATVSVSLDDANSSGLYTYLLLIQGRSADGSGAVVARASHGGTSYNGPRPARLDHLLLQAGTYTIEATTSSVEATGDYLVSVSWLGAVACEEPLADLSGSLSGMLVSVCTSQQRDDDPATTHYAKRYTFTLDSPMWLTVELKSDPAQTPAVDTYLLLMAGHGPGGAVIDGVDDGGADTDAKISNRYLAAGDYTIEATTSEAVGTGALRSSNVRSASADRSAALVRFNLIRTVQTEAEAVGNFLVGGLPPVVWMEQGHTLELPFSAAYRATPVPAAGTPELSGAPVPQMSIRRLFFWGLIGVPVPPSELVVGLDYADGSGTLSLNPARSHYAFARSYLVELAFTSNAQSQAGPDVGRVGFTVKVCPDDTRPIPQFAVLCAVPSMPATPEIQGIARPPSLVPPVALETCIDELSRQRWHMIADISWPDMTSPSTTRCVIPGELGRPARYYVFEVPFETEVTVRLSSAGLNRLILLGPVTTTGSTSSVSISNVVDCGTRTDPHDIVGCVHGTDQGQLEDSDAGP